MIVFICNDPLAFIKANCLNGLIKSGLILSRLFNHFAPISSVTSSLFSFRQ